MFSDLFGNLLMLFGVPILGVISFLVILLYIFRKEELTIEAFILPFPILIFILADAGYLPDIVKYIMLILEAVAVGLAFTKLFRI